MWTQISLIRNPIRRVSSKPDGRPLPSRAHASGPAPRRSRRAASPAPGRRSGLAAAPARPSNPRLLCRRAANLWPCLRAPRARSSHALPEWRVAGVPEGAAREASPPSLGGPSPSPVPPASVPVGPRATSLLSRNNPKPSGKSGHPSLRGILRAER